MAKKILVPLDGSTISERAIAKTLEVVGDSPDVTVIAIRVTELPVDSPLLSPGDLARARDEEHRQIETSLSALQSKLGGLSANLEVKIIDIDEGIAESIIRVAEQEKVDFIAMTSHGRTGLKKLFFGSVAEKVLRLAPCSVLLIKEPS